MISRRTGSRGILASAVRVLSSAVSTSASSAPVRTWTGRAHSCACWSSCGRISQTRAGCWSPSGGASVRSEPVFAGAAEHVVVVLRQAAVHADR